MMNQAETGLSSFVCDLDLVSLYPTIMRVGNVARNTLTRAVYEMEGKSQVSIQNYFSNLIHVRENAESLCTQFHGLPTYTEMENLIRQRLEQPKEATK